MGKPLAIWVTTVFAALVAIAMAWNLVGALTGVSGGTESLIRPGALVVISLVAGLMHSGWAFTTWRLDRRLPLVAMAAAASVFSVVPIWLFAPWLIAERGYVDSLHVRPVAMGFWIAVYALLMLWSLALRRGGRLK